MKAALVIFLALGIVPLAPAQGRRRGGGGGNSAAPPSPNLHTVVVTAVPKRPQTEPVLQGAVAVQQNGKDAKIGNWQRVSDQTAVDLAIIIDEDTQSMGVQLGDVRTFVQQLPPNVRVGVGYMSAGAIQFTQSAFTSDRNLVLQKLRLPSGAPGASPSPYTSVQYLMQRWRPHPGQVHEMLLITDGVEHLGGNNGNNVTLKKAIADTVRAGVVVYSITVLGASNAGNSQNGAPLAGGINFPGSGGPNIVRAPAGGSESNGALNLAQLTDATGGELYSSGGMPARFTTFLVDLQKRLENQYTLTFETAKAKPGLDSVKIDVHAPDDNVTVPKSIFIN